MEERQTIVLDIEQYSAELDFLITYFQRNNVTTVEILFGFVWGNFFGNWQTMNVSPHEIKKTIQKAENETGELFYQNDLFIEDSNGFYSILFCHEGDIHLSFEKQNQLVGTLLERWEELKVLRVN